MYAGLPALFAAWREGRTGYPFVDAAMRQLLAEGWVPNRQRLVAASFLVKQLGIDWRVFTFTLLVSFLTGIGSGVMPVSRARARR